MTWGEAIYLAGMAALVALNDWGQNWGDFLAGCKVLARWLWP